MPVAAQIANYARKMTERRPEPTALQAMLRKRKPVLVHFKDDGIVPNHPHWPLILYRGVVRLDRAGRADAAATIDALFDANGWGRSWRDSIYDFVHYHSQVHEVLGIACGRGRVEFGGIKGRRVELKAGDVAVLPAGTGHRLIEASRDFLVVGAYPPDGSYDECTDTRTRCEAIGRIRKAGRPASDPVFGRKGPLLQAWTRRR